MREAGLHKLLVQELPVFLNGLPGRGAKLLYASYIAKDSDAPKEKILTASIPEMPPEPVARNCRFNRKCRKRFKEAQKQYKAQRKCSLDAQKNIVSQLAGLNPEVSPRTDIYGAIVALEEVFRAYPQAQRMAVIYTDLEDTVHTEINGRPMRGLNPSRIVVRLAQVPEGDSSKERAKRVSSFEKKLSRYGAKVTTLPVHIPLGSVMGNPFNGSY
jgi:hypothetical protein